MFIPLKVVLVSNIKYHVYHGFISLFHDWSSCEACRRFVSCTPAISWKSCMSSISFVAFVSLMLIRISFISSISCISGISCISVTPYIYPLKTGVNLEGKLVSQFCRSCEQLTLGTLGCIKCFLMGFPAIPSGRVLKTWSYNFQPPWWQPSQMFKLWKFFPTKNYVGIGRGNSKLLRHLPIIS